MKPARLRLSIFVPVCFWVSALAAQHTTKNEAARHEPIELLSPKGTNISQPGQIIYKHTGNVKLRHKSVLLFCDQTVQYVTANRLEAIGHVLIVQGDTIIIKADTLVYAGDSRQAILSGRVTFQDRRIVLNAARLDYDLTTGIVHYASRGRLVDSRNVMTSREGHYNTRSRQIEMKQGVRLVSPDNTLTADLLLYNTISRMAVIVSPTRITGKDGVSVAQQGQYDTQNGSMQQRAVSEPPTYAGPSEPAGQVPAPVGSSAKQSESVAATNETRVASQNTRPTVIGAVAANPEMDKPAANSIANLTAAELMMRLASVKTPAAPARKTVDKPAAMVAKANETKPLLTAPVKPANPVAREASEQPERTSSATAVALVTKRPKAPVAQPVKQDAPIQTAGESISLSQSVSVAERVSKPVEKPVSQPVAAEATPPNPQTPLATPAPTVETSVATVNIRPEKTNNAGAGKVVSKMPKPAVAGPVTADKPAGSPLATATPALKITKDLPEASVKPAVKKPASPVREPATPEAPANVAAVTVPKPDEQVLLSTADAKKADLAKAAPKADNLEKAVLPVTAAQPPAAAVPAPSVRTAALRVSVLPAAKRPVKPDALIIPDASMSDLERELNHKKRAH